MVRTKDYPHFVDMLEFELFTDRTLVINGDIEEYLGQDITRQLEILSRETRDITLLISSMGGDVAVGNCILRALQQAQARGCTLIGEVRGYAMSMGAIILQHCDVRAASERDIIMVHGMHGVTVGDIRNQKADLEMNQHITNDWAEFLANRNTSEDQQYHDPAYWLKLLDDDYPHYLFGREAFRQGLLDEVI